MKSITPMKENLKRKLMIVYLTTSLKGPKFSTSVLFDITSKAFSLKINQSLNLIVLITTNKKN